MFHSLEALYRLKTHADSGHFLPIHEAAVVAMVGGQDFIPPRNAIYQKRRDIVMDALEELGAPFERPKGAMYVWFSCPEGRPSVDFTLSILEETGVSMAPGMMFGHQGEGYVRLSLCVPEERLGEAMERLKEWWRDKIYP